MDLTAPPIAAADADADARALGHGFLAPEHLLLAVVGAGARAGRAFFERRGLTRETLRAWVVALTGPKVATRAPAGPLAIGLRAQVAFGHVVGAGRPRDGASPYSADDLLLALLADVVAGVGVVGALLERMELTPAEARTELAALTDRVVDG